MEKKSKNRKSYLIITFLFLSVLCTLLCLSSNTIFISAYTSGESYTDPQGYEWTYVETTFDGEVFQSIHDSEIKGVKNSMGNICLFVAYESLAPEESCLDGDLIYNNYGCVIRAKYETITYSYEYFSGTGKDCKVYKITDSDGELTIEYDLNGNLRKKLYSSTPELNTEYEYYPDNSFKKVRQGGKEISYTYEPSSGRVHSETTKSRSGVVTSVIYEYDEEGKLVKMISLGRTEEYVYDSRGNLIRYTIKIEKDGERLYEETEEYEYDENDSIITEIGVGGEETYYEYETEEYPCSEISCLDENCSDYEIIDSICTYERPKSKQIEKYSSQVTYDAEGEVSSYCSNFDSGCYSPIEKYDDNGYLIEDNDFTYQWTDGVLISSTSKSDPSYKETYEYDTQGFLYKIIYPEPDTWDKYEYDAFGRVISITYHAPKGEETTTVTGYAIKSILTGFVAKITGRAGDEEYEELVLYATVPGDFYSFLTKEEIEELIASENIDPQLKQIIQENGVIVETDYRCIDSDSYVSFDNSTFISSYIENNTGFYYDSCINNNTLREYYCGLEFRWDIWNIFAKRAVKSKDVVCSIGCLNNACIKPAEETIGTTEECRLDSDCSRGVCLWKGGDGDPCMSNKDCDSNYCDMGLCSGGERGNKCIYDCPDSCYNYTNPCLNNNPAQPVGYTSPAGGIQQYCTFDSDCLGGVCIMGMCSALKEANQPCIENKECLSGVCDMSLCKETTGECDETLYRPCEDYCYEDITIPEEPLDFPEEPEEPRAY